MGIHITTAGPCKALRALVARNRHLPVGIRSAGGLANGDILTVARVDPRAKIFIELAGLNPYEYIPPVRTTSRVHITAGGIRNELLQKVHSFSREQLQTIEGSYRLSEEIAHQGIATATPSFSQRLQSFGYSVLSPDTTPTRGLFDRE